MSIYAGIYYVPHTENVCFRLEKRTFHAWKTYGSQMKNIKNISSCYTILSSVLQSTLIPLLFAFNLLILWQKYPEKEWMPIYNLLMFIPLLPILYRMTFQPFSTFQTYQEDKSTET